MDPASSPNSNRMMSQQHIEIRHSPRVAGTFSDSDFPMVLVAPSARGRAVLCTPAFVESLSGASCWMLQLRARPRTWLLDGDDTVVPNCFHADWRSLAWLVVVKHEPILWKPHPCDFLAVMERPDGVPTNGRLEHQRVDAVKRGRCGCGSSRSKVPSTTSTDRAWLGWCNDGNLENVVLGSCIGSIVRAGNCANRT